MTTQTPVGPIGPAPEVRILRRSRTDRVIGGVCGGLGRYLGVDPVLLRIAAVALALSGGVGVLAYIVAWIAIPEAVPGDEPVGAPMAPAARSGSASLVVGAALLVLGTVLFVRQVVPWFEMAVVWPILLLVVGLLVIVSTLRRGSR
ncbi:PspC domain-containing protein [Spirilliplanes yamanashiensis]|uniref:Phage shock protein PspC N-terminal domain-containing protein n=1 Tax=Spirilliplanes yamanashiensis TaxID=42233 RepID=A0A8J3YFD4_9ACTN|nr:PspC domain-containing protein [Spirilliplanes yamanashiensis]MDP9818230.1 phage shock protein C [Spirilliplanes yamanashiensis]GIJ06742.1 hypothetical protein Sya03_60940 [Spirilliplanes yamanashiensis]